MGRKPKPVASTDIIVGFKAAPAFVREIDEEAIRMAAERPEESSKVSRSEAIKILLREALKARAQSRTERQ